MSERRVAVIGTGLIGRAWAISFARGGCRVALYDPVEGAGAAALEIISPLLDELHGNGLLNGAEPAAVMSRIMLAGSLEAALEGAEHVQENAPERLEVKIEVTAQIAALAGPEAVIASSSSGFVPSAFSADAEGRHRCLVGHPINPPYLVPAVEVVPAPWTDPGIVERTYAFYEAVGQAPIRMARELDGFIMNRMQAALLQEAFRLVAEGYASAEDVDRGIGQGLGLRWSFMGPFETIDLNAPGGIRDYAARYEPLCRRLVEDQGPPCDWMKALDDGLEAERAAALPRERLAARQTWRDRRLMALAARKAGADEDIGR